VLKANLQSLFNGNVIIGTDAGKSLVSTGGASDNNTIVGDGAGAGSGSATYYGNSFFGTDAGKSTVDAYYNSFFGFNAGAANVSGEFNCFYGLDSGAINTGGRNSCFGVYSGNYITTGTNNVFIGFSAGGISGAGSYDTCVGVNAGAGAFTDAGAFGYNASASGNQRIRLGSNTVNIEAQAALIVLSDARDKADVTPTVLGLSFINKLKPSTYKWDLRDDYDELDDKTCDTIHHEKDSSKKRTRYHHGFIAQEVKALSDEMGFDFAAYKDSSINGGKDVLGLCYEEFIAPMVKAIQELSAKVDALEKQLNPSPVEEIYSIAEDIEQRR